MLIGFRHSVALPSAAKCNSTTSFSPGLLPLSSLWRPMNDPWISCFFYQNFLWKNSVFILLLQLWHILSWSKWETGTLLAKTGNRRILSNSTSFTSRIAYHSFCKIFHDCHANQYGYRQSHITHVWNLAKEIDKTCTCAGQNTKGHFYKIISVILLLWL